MYEVIYNPGMEPYPSGWRWIYEPQVEGSTSCRTYRFGKTTVSVPGPVKLYTYGIISDPGMGPYPPRVALAL